MSDAVRTRAQKGRARETPSGDLVERDATAAAGRPQAIRMLLHLAHALGILEVVFGDGDRRQQRDLLGWLFSLT